MTTRTTRRRLLGALAGGAAAAVGCGVVGRRLELLAEREGTRETLLTMGQGLEQAKPPTPQRLTDEEDEDVAALARDVARGLHHPAPVVRYGMRAMLVEVFGREEVERRLGLPTWDQLLADARAAGLRVVEHDGFQGRVQAVLGYDALGLRAGLEDVARRRLVADALARPRDADVFHGGRWLMAERRAA
jgi:hypothetical protein